MSKVKNRGVMIHSKTFTQFIEQASAPAPKPDLNALRQASASATMAGPSKEAQALMSDRTKNILSGQSVYGGSNKLKAGTDAQVGVEKMKTAMSTPPAATQQTPPPAATQQTPPPPATQQTPPPPATQQTPPPLTTQQQSMYDMARRNKGNPMIKARFNSLSPEEQAAFRAQAKADGVDFGF
jgi:hypothetical protein